MDLLVVRLFREVVAEIDQADNENQLRSHGGLNFHKLKGKKGIYAIRLNRNWRLEFTIETVHGGNVIHLKEISNHYGD